MIGVVWKSGSWGGAKVIGTIAPLSADGSSDAEGEQVVAPKGYVVGGMKVCAPPNQLVSHVQLIYMKLNDDGTLDPSSTKLSKWMGGNPNGKIVEISGQGKKVVGLTGRAGLVVNALGLLFESKQ